MLLDFDHLLVFLRDQLRPFLLEQLHVFKSVSRVLQLLLQVFPLLFDNLEQRVSVVVSQACVRHLLVFSCQSFD